MTDSEFVELLRNMDTEDKALSDKDLTNNNR